MITSHKELLVWQKSMRLVILVYKLTKGFPKDEQFGLVSQMRRAGVSIASNIAEGKNRGTRKEYRQFLLIAYGSANELETQLEIVRQLSYGIESELDEATAILTEVLKMLNVIIGRLVDI